MKIIVCCKLIPEEQDISIKVDGSLDMSKAEPKISPFDLNAVETALQVRAAVEGSTITAMSLGGKSLENTKARKDILSRGPDALTILMDPAFENLLPDQTAEVLAAATTKEGFDLILCGDGSGDLYAQQVGIRLGALLGVPVLSGVSKLLSATASTITVERALEHEVEVLEIALPAVLSVSTDINVPTIPGMKAILGAAKKPITTLTAADVPLATALVEKGCVLAPKKTDRKNIVVEGDSDEKISEFVANVYKLLK